MAIESIKRRKGTVYRVSVRIGKRKQSRCFKRKLDAENWERAMLVKRNSTSDSHQGVPALPPLSLDDLRTKYELEHGTLRQAPATLKLETGIYNLHIKPHLGAFKLDKIGSNDIEAWMATLSRAKSVSNGRINKARVLLNAMFNWSLRRRLIRSNPVADVEPLPTNGGILEQDFNYLSQEEACRLLDWLKIHDSWLYPKVRVLLNFGLRHGEMAALRVQDVSLTNEGGILRVSRTFCRHTLQFRNRTKGGRSRAFAIGPSMANLFRPLITAKTGDSPLLWNDWKEAQDPWRFGKHFRKALVAANVPRIRIHDLRHTFAVHFLEREGHLYDLQKLLGHSTSKLTERYAHFSQAMLDRSCAIVDHHGEGRPRLAVVDGGLRSTMSHKCPTKSEHFSKPSVSSSS